MAVFRWVPKAASVAQYESYTPDAGTLGIRATIGGIVISGGGGSLAAAITDFCDNFNASTHPYFAGITATGGAAAFSLEADVAGVEYTALIEEDDGTGLAWATLAASVSTPATGAAHWNNVENWRTELGATAAAYPQTSGDVCIFDNTSQGVHYGFNALYTVSGGYYNIQIITGSEFTGGIGLQRECFQTDVAGSTFDTSVDEYRMGLRILNAGCVIDGSPKFVSFNFSSSDGTQNFIFRHSRIDASVGLQDKCVEMRVVGDSKGSSLIGKLYQSSGGVEIKSEYATKYDYQIDAYVNGGELWYGDLSLPSAAGRIRYAYLDGGTFYTRTGGLVSAVYGSSGKWVPLDLRVLLECKIYTDCIFDFRYVKSVSIAAGKKLLIYGGEIRSAISSPVIAFPGGYTLYLDLIYRLSIQTCSSFAPSAFTLSSSSGMKKRLSIRRNK